MYNRNYAWIRLRANPRVIATVGVYPKNIKFNPVTAVIINVKYLAKPLQMRNLYIYR